MNDVFKWKFWIFAKNVSSKEKLIKIKNNIWYLRIFNTKYYIQFI